MENEAKLVSFDGNSHNLYFTLTEFDVKIEGCLKTGKATITGRCGKVFNPDDVLEINKQKFIVLQETERRDLGGKSKNQKDDINSYFKVECKFERFIS